MVPDALRPVAEEESRVILAPLSTRYPCCGTTSPPDTSEVWKYGDPHDPLWTILAECGVCRFVFTIAQTLEAT